jgi:hypothetical protein
MTVGNLTLDGKKCLGLSDSNFLKKKSSCILILKEIKAGSFMFLGKSFTQLKSVGVDYMAVKISLMIGSSVVSGCNITWMIL